MKLSNISNLYHEMKNNKQSRRQFPFEYNGVLSDVFFFIDQTPYILAFGIVSTQTYFELEVNPGFNVKTPFSHEIYSLIVKEFHISYDPNHKYHPTDFLEAVNRKFPQHINETKSAEPSHIVKYHRDVEEADKIYFCGFIDQRKCGRRPRDKNLQKTKTLMGEEAYQRCLREDISTKWTDEKGKDRFKHWKDITQSDYSDS